MGNLLTQDDWDVLLEHIDEGHCTPFLGAGVGYGTLPLGSDIAKRLAKEFDYPFDDDYDLPKVSQYVATNFDPRHAKRAVLKQLAECKPPVFDLNEPHGVLADLPLPLYMTTNYDSFIYDALRARKKKPARESFRWNDLLKSNASIFDEVPSPSLHPATPLVFHFHGYDKDANSLVLTEDDFFEFAEKTSVDRESVPKAIRIALAESSLLFIGYRLADWNLRVLLRAVRPHFRSMGVVVMPPPTVKTSAGTKKLSPAQKKAEEATCKKRQKKQQQYLDEHYGAMKLRVYWGTAKDFCKELHRRYMAKYGAGK